MRAAVLTGRAIFAREIKQARGLGFQLQVAAVTDDVGEGVSVAARLVAQTPSAKAACRRAHASATGIQAEAHADRRREGDDALRECIGVVLERAREIS